MGPASDITVDHVERFQVKGFNIESLCRVKVNVVNWGLPGRYNPPKWYIFYRLTDATQIFLISMKV